jgi:hypothetical protein
MGDTILTGDKKSFKHEICRDQASSLQLTACEKPETAKIVAIYRWNVND